MSIRMLLASLLLASAAHAQTAPPDPTASKVYTYVEQMPVFSQDQPGSDGLMQYLGQNLRYPAAALRDQITGKVFVQFVITETGDVTQARVVQGVHESLDAEALRVVAAMPRWAAPGQQAGRPVSVAYTVPVTFNVAFSTSEQVRLEQAGQANLKTMQAAGDAVARFPGGPRALVHYLHQAPPAGQPDQVVFVEFRLDKQGDVTDAHAFSFSPEEAAQQLAGTGEAAVNLVKRMPRWQPARRRGRAVPVEMTLPVGFSTQPDDTTALPALPYADVPPALALHGGPSLDAEAALSKYISYPYRARQQGIEGDGVVFFMVNELAQVEQVQMLKSAGAVLDATVLRAVRQLRPSAPAMHQGRPVRVYYTIPFDFTINQRF